MDELDDDLNALFEMAEANAVAHDWNWRTRALSRAILKLAGLYKEGVYAEDEIENTEK